jgi:hypothetical protein
MPVLNNLSVRDQPDLAPESFRTKDKKEKK